MACGVIVVNKSKMSSASDLEESFEENIVNKRKKGVKQVEYQREKIKKARVKGAAYINYKGNLVPEKQRGEPCR